MAFQFEIPKMMTASVIRTDRLGSVLNAFQLEKIEIPKIAPDEVLIKVKYAGVNYNAIWAAKGIPINVIAFRNKKGEKEDFHIAGSDGAGVIYKIGERVKSLNVGQDVIIHPGRWDSAEDWIKTGGDPMLSDSVQAWGYETNYGSFAEFTKVKETQCIMKPTDLSWEDSASFLLCGATAYRMLTHWKPNTIQKGDIVLIWGGSGGLGSFAIQLVRIFGGIPVAIVNSRDKMDFCYNNGAEFVINRSEFNHWGMVDFSLNNREKVKIWKLEFERFTNTIFEGIGKRELPSIVFEHPGESTLPTSLAICKKGGMVVSCGATSGYVGNFDLSLLNFNQIRFQGSHFANVNDCNMVTKLISERKIKTNITRTFSINDIGMAHQMLEDGKLPIGNFLIRIENKKSPSYNQFSE